ncbi:MAG: hypothetical protein MJ120_04690 [Clostridia bacterium]|nr:hypothetical protein [Clostridia bacterium]
MKKIIALISTLLLLLSLSSCKVAESDKKDPQGEKKETHSGILSGIFSGKEKETTTTTTMGEEEVSHLADKLEKGRLDSFASYSDKEKQQIKQQVEKDGYSLEINEDGSGTLSNEEGSWYVGKGWYDNEYAMDVPPIDFGSITMSGESDEGDGKFYIYLIRSATVYQVADYVESLKSAGFTEKVESDINTDAGVVSFSGSNKDGKRVVLGYSQYGFTVKIYK